MKCTLCKHPVLENKDEYKIITDEWFTYFNLVHKKCYRRYGLWMRIQSDKEWLVYANQNDPMIDYHRVSVQVDIPDFFWDDEYLRWTTHPDVPRGRTFRQVLSMLAPDEYPMTYDERMYDNQDYNHPGSHGPDVDWYGELGTARIYCENYEEVSY